MKNDTTVSYCLYSASTAHSGDKAGEELEGSPSILFFFTKRPPSLRTLFSYLSSRSFTSLFSSIHGMYINLIIINYRNNNLPVPSERHKSG